MKENELSQKARDWLKAHGFAGKARDFEETTETLEFMVSNGDVTECHLIRWNLGWSTVELPRRRR